MPAMSNAMQVFTGMVAISTLFMLASLVLVADNRTVNRRARMVFLFCIASVALINVADWFNFVIGPAYPDLRWLHVVSMAITFALAPIFTFAIAHTLFPEPHVTWMIVLLALQIVLEVATIFGGFVFWVDAANVYHRGPFYIAYMATYSVSALYLAFESIKAGRTYQSVNIVSVLVILLFLVVGVGIQIIDSSIRTTWPAVGMAIFLYFQSYSEMVLRTDALTKLLNRHSYDEFLDNPRLPCTVVQIDVDSFKQINDTYGHAYGDVCLKTIARLIRQAFGSAGLCFRTGGDEFTVMVVKRQDETTLFVHQLESCVFKAQDKDPRIPTVSVGMAHAPADQTDLQPVINAADKNMYEAKRLRKSQA